jgi:hypothetical protein
MELSFLKKNSAKKFNPSHREFDQNRQFPSLLGPQVYSANYIYEYIDKRRNPGLDEFICFTRVEKVGEKRRSSIFEIKESDFEERKEIGEKKRVSKEGQKRLSYGEKLQKIRESNRSSSSSEMKEDPVLDPGLEAEKAIVQLITQNSGLSQ